MAKDKEISISKMKAIINCLLEYGWLKEDDCEEAVLDFQNFLENTNLSILNSYDEMNDRLDDFFYEYMFKKRYDKIWSVTKYILILSHGQASIERGFSINKNMEVENLKEQSYISLRIIKDYIEYCGGVSRVPITKDLLASASCGRQRYMSYLKDQKDEKEKRVKDERKRKFGEDLKKKKKCMEGDIKELISSADKLSLKAKMTFCIQSNSLRKTAKEKEVEVKNIEKDIENKIKELKG